MKIPHIENADLTRPASEQYETLIVIWSRIGHTPITHRRGSYCDELDRCTIYCESPREAEFRLRELMEQTPHAYKGYYYLPDYPNQNVRDRWVVHPNHK